MSLVIFLNILGMSVGLLSIGFFAFGAATMTTKGIYRTVVVSHNINQHWYESASKQRAEYIVGAILLFLSFGFQLAANLVPADWSPTLLQSRSCVAYTICSVFAVLLFLSLLARHWLTKSCICRVLKMWEQKIDPTSNTGQC